MHHFADRIADAVRTKGNALCVGLDPRWDSLPLSIRMRHGDHSLQTMAAAYEEFCGRVLDVVAPLVPVVKPQSAFFEACGPDGMAVMQRLLRKARKLGLLTILDAKRNDIASTATAYADAAFGGVALAGRVHPVWEADALTVNPYLGRDAVEPFLQSARRVGAGVFVLVRTSNPGAGLFQDLIADGRPVYQHVAEAVAGWAAREQGPVRPGRCRSGGRRHLPGGTGRAAALDARRALSVPGYGAQGGGVGDVAPAFREDGLAPW